MSNPVKTYQIIVKEKVPSIWDWLPYALFGLAALLGVGYLIEGIARLKD